MNRYWQVHYFTNLQLYILYEENIEMASVVDKYFPDSGKFVVYTDNHGNPYSDTLVNTDVKNNTNKFYIIQSP